MLGLLKLICPTLTIGRPICLGSIPMIVAVTMIACFAEISAVQAQRAVYPYPGTQPTNGATHGVLTGFAQQGQGLVGQTPLGQTPFGQSVLNQSLVDPRLPAPTLAVPNPQQGLIGQNVFGGQPVPQPQGFPPQQNLGAQPSLIPQTGFAPQNGFAPQTGFTPNGVPQGALPADLTIVVSPGATGKLVAGGTVGSDNGFVGEIIIDERDFNIFAFPRSLRDLSDPRVFRGRGQSFRAEIVPGEDLERYLVSIGDPYFLDSGVSVNLSGYYFDRQYFDWDEQRSGVKLRLGRTLTNFLSIRGGLQFENVNIDNPRLNTSAQLNADLGNSNLFSFDVGLVYDTRQSPYLLDSGEYLAATFRQAFGDFDFSRAEIDFRIQRLLFKRTATTGHHTLSYRTKLGFSGGSTPVFENFFAGGTTSLRGFEFRGVSPIDGDVRVGGEFQWLNSLEYQFPITNDDMIMGVAFIDFGTVEESIEINSDNFRIAPGVGLRANVPFLGISAPISLDFAFATDEAAGDDKTTISFLFGVVR